MQKLKNASETTKPRVALFEAVHPVAATILQEHGFTVDSMNHSPSAQELADLAKTSTLIGVRSKTKLSAQLLRASPELTAIGCFCIGTDQVDASAAALGIPIFNAPFSNTRSVAEMTLAEIICLSRALFQKSSQLHVGRWDKSSKNSREVRGRTLGIIGYGHIGSQLSVLAESLGMRVVYFDTARKLALGNAQSLPTLDAVLATADFVSLHVPDIVSTRGLIGAAQLKQMKPGAMLVNNSRGKVVDLVALAAALKSGHVGGAAVDVFPEEPAENGAGFSTPLAGLPNVILTPHIGGSTEEAQEGIAVDVAEKLARFWTQGGTAASVNFPQVDLPNMRSGQVRILHVHQNVPGVLSKMHTLLAQAGVNINAEHLQSDQNTSYVILDVDAFQDTNIMNSLRTLPETIRMRVAG
jgi:D-3-phosphoglycerate dehydrogenase